MSSARILIVEDENIVTMELKDRLQMLGHTVVAVASSGEQAIERAGETNPDLALMDIRLKGNIDGVEAAERIHMLYDVPVVFLTAYSDEATLQRVKLAEPFGYLIKPFEERELHSTIEMALYKHSMERRLREQKQWLAAILTSIGDAVIATDRHACVQYINPVAEALTGWPEAEALGTLSDHLLPLIDSETRAPIVSPIRQALHDGRELNAGEGVLLVARGGIELPVDYNAAPLKNPRGEAIGVVLVLRDMTEHKRIQQELLHSERLAAIGHFAASLAHEINNPLQSLTLSLGLVLSSQVGEKERRARLEAMRSEIRRLMSLTRDVLGFAADRPTKRQRLDVCEIVRYALSLTSKQLERAGIEACVDLPDSLPAVNGSRDQLVQVLLNLIVNAIDAMPTGGRMELAARCDGHVTLAVRDTGSGLPPSVLEHLFRPFHTTKSGGTGLGLSVSNSIVRQHGGSIEAANAADGGAIFTVTLPAA